MKPEDIMDSMNNIDDDIISEVQNIRTKKKNNKMWIKWVAVAACFCLVVGGIFGHFHFRKPQAPSPSAEPGTTLTNSSPAPLNPFSVSNAVYPQMMKFPTTEDFTDSNGNIDWEAYSVANNQWYSDFDTRTQNRASASDYGKFINSTVKTFFADTKNQNLVYSPLNVYMALSLLAESTDGQTRQEILDLLGVGNIDELRKYANKLWLSNYSDDGLKTNVLANSVWLSDIIDYNQSTLDLIAKNYYASSFSGTMGSAEYNKTLQNWLNEQTGGLLKEQADGVEFYDSTVLGLASTVYFKAGWKNEFSEHLTKPDIFHGTNGDENIDFMYQRITDYPIYSDDHYTATYLPFNNTGKMWLILPDDGFSPEALLKNGDINSILNGSTPKNTHSGTITNLYMPKFDVASSMDLVESINQLGVSEVFDETIADFSPVMPSQSAYVSQINHSARVTVDEKGCTAAAFTVIAVDTESFVVGKEVDFRLNKPFIFVITSDDSTPLFVGVVNTVK